MSIKPPSKLSETTETKTGPAKWASEARNAFVHPSAPLEFPDHTNPHPDEIDNYSPVMDYFRNEVFA